MPMRRKTLEVMNDTYADGLREPKDETNAYKTVEGDWEDKAVKSLQKRLWILEDET